MAEEATPEEAMSGDAVSANTGDRQVSARTHPGLILGIARFYYDPRGAMRGVLDSQPSEPRLLAYIMIAAMVLLAGRLVQLSFAGGEQVLASSLAQTVSLLFFMPLACYGLAALGTWVSRKFGGVGNWSNGRAAFFWATLVSSPVTTGAALFQVVLGTDGLAHQVVGQIGSVFLAWALAVCFAETFGFKRVLLVLAFMLGVVLAMIFGMWALLK
ncbi:MAG: hypothetical protein AAF557_17675 [Pseudomonadota bacterium]